MIQKVLVIREDWATLVKVGKPDGELAQPSRENGPIWSAGTGAEVAVEDDEALEEVSVPVSVAVELESVLEPVALVPVSLLEEESVVVVSTVVLLPVELDEIVESVEDELLLEELLLVEVLEELLEDDETVRTQVAVFTVSRLTCVQPTKGAAGGVCAPPPVTRGTNTMPPVVQLNEAKGVFVPPISALHCRPVPVPTVVTTHVGCTSPTGTPVFPATPRNSRADPAPPVAKPAVSRIPVFVIAPPSTDTK
jgi:hypothetical protein